MNSYNEFLADLLIEKVQNIPDPIKKAFIKRAVDDARVAIKEIKNDTMDLQKLSYIIYKAYLLGAALYDGDKLIELTIEKDSSMDEIEISEKKEKINTNKVVYFNQYKNNDDLKASY